MPHKTLVLGLKEIQKMLQSSESAPLCQVLKPAKNRSLKERDQWHEITRVVEVGKEKGLFWESNEVETPIFDLVEEVLENPRRTWDSLDTLESDAFKPPSFPRKP